MSRELLNQFREAVNNLSVTSTEVGYEGGSKNLSVADDDMRRNLIDAYTPILRMFNELLHSRDEYQKAADKMALV